MTFSALRLLFVLLTGLAFCTPGVAREYDIKRASGFCVG